MPRVHTTTKNSAGKSIKCGRCGTEIQPREQYRHWTFRYGGKHIRCMKSDCSPRSSDLTQGKIGQVYELNERLEDAVSDLRSSSDVETFKSEAESIKDDAEGVRDEFQDSLDNMPEGLQQGDTGQMIESRVSALDDFVSELESAIDNIEEVDPDACQDCGEAEGEPQHETDTAKIEKNKDIDYHDFNPPNMDEAAENVASEFDSISCDAD